MSDLKKSIVGLVVSFCMVAGVAFPQALFADSADTQPVLETRSFRVENMTCATCPITVKKAMSRVDGVKSIDIDFQTATARVTYDPTLAEPQDIADASSAVGFAAAVLQGPVQ